MKINLQNYESFLLDYMENKLNPLLQKQVEEFLALHPELEEEMQVVSENFPLSGKEGQFKGKLGLIRSMEDVGTINETNFEEHCIAYYEGELSESRSQELEQFASESANRNNLFKLHGQLHFVPDTRIRYEGKVKLKKSKNIVFPQFVLAVASVAAVLIFGVFIYNSVFKAMPITDIQIADNNEHATNQEEKAETKPADQTEKPKEKSSAEKKAAQLQPVILAKFDTTDSRKQEKVELASIQPLVQVIPNEIMADASLKIELPVQNDNKIITEEEVTEKITKKEDEPVTHLLARSKDQLILEAVSIGIKGFNNLTENNLALSTEQDEAGNVESFKLESERFEFKRKIRKNM